MGVILLAVCTLPFVVTTLGRKKKEKLLFKQLTELAERNGSKVSTFDIWSKTAIGMSEKEDKVFFIKQMESKRKEISISLNKIKLCQIISENRLINNQSGNYKVIDKLILYFSHVTSKESDVALEIYNADGNVQLGDELKMIEKWESIINERVKTLVS